MLRGGKLSSLLFPFLIWNFNCKKLMTDCDERRATGVVPRISSTEANIGINLLLVFVMHHKVLSRSHKFWLWRALHNNLLGSGNASCTCKPSTQNPNLEKRTIMLEPRLLETGNFDINMYWRKRLGTPPHLFKKEVQPCEILVNFECVRFDTHLT